MNEKLWLVSADYITETRPFKYTENFTTEKKKKKKKNEMTLFG